MFRLSADAAASSARFERLNEFGIYIPNDEIGHTSSKGTMNDINESCEGYAAKRSSARYGPEQVKRGQVIHGVNRQNRIDVFGIGLRT